MTKGRLLVARSQQLLFHRHIELIVQEFGGFVALCRGLVGGGIQVKDILFGGPVGIAALGAVAGLLKDLSRKRRRFFAD